MMDEISKGHLFGAYGIKVSNDMTEILQKYMIENVSLINQVSFQCLVLQNIFYCHIFNQFSHRLSLIVAPSL